MMQTTIVSDAVFQSGGRRYLQRRGGGGDAMSRKIRLNMRNRTKAIHAHVLLFRIAAKKKGAFEHVM